MVDCPITSVALSVVDCMVCELVRSSPFFSHEMVGRGKPVATQYRLVVLVMLAVRGLDTPCTTGVTGE